MIDRMYWSLPFYKNIRNQSNKYINGLLDENKGSCWDFLPIIFVNGYLQVNPWIRLIGEVGEIDDYSIEEIKRHEFFHYYSLVGSPLGSLYHLLFCIKKAVFKDLIELLSISNFKNRLKPPFFLLTSNITVKDKFRYELLTTILRLLYTTKSLFVACGVTPLNDYALSLLTLVDFFDGHGFFDLTNDQKLELRRALSFRDNIPPDMVGYSSNSYPSNAPEYHPSSGFLLISVRDILEAYARTCEFIELERVAEKDKRYGFVIKEFAEKSLHDEYTAALNILNLVLKPNTKKMPFAHFFPTSLVILEISLFSEFHPALFPKKIPYNWTDDILIPQRFRHLCDYFAKKKISFSAKDLKDNERMMSTIDNICDEIGWSKYSNTLEKLISYWAERGPNNIYGMAAMNSISIPNTCSFNRIRI